MAKDATLGTVLRSRGISRRGFLQYCATLASLMALPAAMAPSIARALEAARRPSVIWLSFQECTGCTESLTRSQAPTVEDLILGHISLDYHHTLQAASGDAAEAARHQAMAENKGAYLLLVDGSIPLADPAFSTIAGISNLDMLLETVEHAAAIVSIGSCAAYGGLPAAKPNPTGAASVRDVLAAHGIDKPVLNIPGCPPIPMVITGTLAHYLTFGALPALDDLGRPKSFYGVTIHDRCYRRPFYDRGLFARSFDDEGARKGWCLFELGCKGPTTRNACATIKWNNSASFPIQSGHPCLGCSQPDFWDTGGFYKSISVPFDDPSRVATYAAIAGAAVGIGAAGYAYNRHLRAENARGALTVKDVEG